jgi:hypothetical protein
LHQYQRPARSSRRGGSEKHYIEVTVEDLELGTLLAHEVLGRTLDELPPQTRLLLSLVREMAKAQCAKLDIKRSDYRFSRREIREHTRWGDTQLKIHLARLVELEYVLAHRGGRGQSFEYELLYDGVNDEARHLSGLIDVEALRCAYDAQWSGVSAEWSGVGRPSVGVQSGGGRVTENHFDAGKTRAKVESIAKEAKMHGTRGNGHASSYVDQSSALAAPLS